MTPIFPKSISDIQYIYRTSNIYLDVRYLYPTSDILYLTWLGLGLGQGYRMSDIDIGRRIYILDVLYRFRKHWWHSVLNGASYTTLDVKLQLFGSERVKSIFSFVRK